MFASLQVKIIFQNENIFGVARLFLVVFFFFGCKILKHLNQHRVTVMDMNTVFKQNVLAGWLKVISWSCIALNWFGTCDPMTEGRI